MIRDDLRSPHDMEPSHRAELSQGGALTRSATTRGDEPGEKLAPSHASTRP